MKSAIANEVVAISQDVNTLVSSIGLSEQTVSILVATAVFLVWFYFASMVDT